MKRIFLVSVLVAGLGVGCSEDALGTEVITTTWDVSSYTVVMDECGAVTENPTADPPIVFEGFDIEIDGDVATLASSDNIFVPGTDTLLGGVTTTYDPADVTVEFTFTFTDSPMAEPDCVVELMDTFTVDLENTSVSLDQNTTVQVTWDHRETDISATPGTCTPAVWFNIDLPCDSQATFTLTQQQTQ